MLSKIVANSDIHFNLDNKKYLFTIIKREEKIITKSESVLCLPTLSLFVYFNFFISVCLSSVSLTLHRRQAHA